MTSYVYEESAAGVWTVGFYSPDGAWHAESDHDHPAAAAAWVARLNGSDEAVVAALAEVTAERDLLRSGQTTLTTESLDSPAGRAEIARTSSTTNHGTADPPDPRQVADALLRRHMDQVETELEVMLGILAGARRAVDRAGDPTPVAAGYQRWELALQRMEVAYLGTARTIGHLRESSEWQKIIEIWGDLQELVQHWREDVLRFGSSVVQRWDESLRATVAGTARAIGDLALQVAAGLDSAPTTTEALQHLASTGHEVADRLGDSRSPKPYDSGDVQKGAEDLMVEHGEAENVRVRDPDLRELINATRPANAASRPGPSDIPARAQARPALRSAGPTVCPSPQPAPPLVSPPPRRPVPR
jgi:hypothetical protein